LKYQNFVGPTYSLQSLNYDCERTINLYPEKNEIGTGKEQEVAMLCSTPGLTLLHSLPRSPIRGIHYTANGYIYVVAGNGLYNLTTTDGISYTHTLLGYLQTSTGPVSIADGVPNMYLGIANTGLINQVVIVDGSTAGLCFEEGTIKIYQIGPSSLTIAAGSFVSGYEYTILTVGTTNFTTIGAANNNIGTSFVATGVGTGTGTATYYTASGYAGSAFVTFQDGYFFFSQPQTISGFYAADPLNISDLDVFNVNLGSDQVSRVISDHGILWAFGNRSLSVWQNTGGSSTSNTFQQIPGAEAEGGCNAPYSIAQVAGQLIWTTNDDRGYGAVFVALGYRGVRISNHAVEQWLQSFEDISGATAWTYQEGGHSFYCLNVPGSTTTWCYDTVAQMWSERAYFSSGSYSRDLVSCHANATISGIGSIHLVGDYQSGNIYKLDGGNYTHNGVPIRRMRTAPHVSGSYNRVFYSALQVDLEAGVGLGGAGYQVLDGYSNAVTTTTATNTYLAGNGPTYTLTGNDGLPALPTGTVTVTGNSSNWSNSYTVNTATGVVTINSAALPVTYANFGTGNGTQTTFSIPNFYSESVASYSISVTDWRGTFTPAIYPAYHENLCQSSYDFNYAGIWTLTGVNAVPSSWAPVIVTVATTANSPSSYSPNNLTVSNPAYAYGATGLTCATSGNAATANITGTGTITSGSITYSGFSGGAFTGTLNIGGLFGTYWGALPITLSISHDGGGNQQITNLGNPLGSASVVSIFISVASLSTLTVTLTLSSTFIQSNITLYDIVCLNYSVATGINTIYAPDGSNTGTFLTEDSSLALHQISTTYPLNSPGFKVFSVYALAGDANRYLQLGMGDQAEYGVYSNTVVYNISSGSIVSGSGGTITPIGNGIYRCSIYNYEGVGYSPTGNSSTGIATISLLNSASSSVPSYSGNGKSMIGIWGAQIETVSASPYLPTPYLSTAGGTSIDYCLLYPQTGSVSFNNAPFAAVTQNTTTGIPVSYISIPAATISATVTVNSPQSKPTEYQASFQYQENVPNYVNIGTDPHISLSYSDDGGHTFSSEKSVSIGKIGDRYRRAIWRRLGQSRDRVFRVTCSDPVKLTLLGARIDAVVGNK